MGGSRLFSLILYSVRFADPTPTSAFRLLILLRTNTELILQKFGDSRPNNTTITDELIIFGRNCTREGTIGSRIRQKITIDDKPVLPRSEWLHEFRTYDTLRPQGWRVHYTLHRRRHHMTAGDHISIVIIRIAGKTDKNLHRKVNSNYAQCARPISNSVLHLKIARLFK